MLLLKKNIWPREKGQIVINSYSSGNETYWANQTDTVAADDPASCVARSTAARSLTIHDYLVLFSTIMNFNHMTDLSDDQW